MKKFNGAITHNNQECDVLYIPTDAFDAIPDSLVLKAHAVCFHENKMLLVHHSKWDVWGIPGGTREPGESIEETLRRELKEEAGCNIVDCKPISYQKITTLNNDTHYRLQYACNVRSFKEFKSDSGGNIDKIIWIDPDDYQKYIEKKEMRTIIVQRGIDEHQNVL